MSPITNSKFGFFALVSFHYTKVSVPKGQSEIEIVSTQRDGKNINARPATSKKVKTKGQTKKAAASAQKTTTGTKPNRQAYVKSPVPNAKAAIKPRLVKPAKPDVMFSSDDDNDVSDNGKIFLKCSRVLLTICARKFKCVIVAHLNYSVVDC